MELTVELSIEEYNNLINYKDKVETIDFKIKQSLLNSSKIDKELKDLIMNNYLVVICDKDCPIPIKTYNMEETIFYVKTKYEELLIKQQEDFINKIHQYEERICKLCDIISKYKILNE